MIQDYKAQMLIAFLGKLPETLAVRLAKAVELDRLAEGKSLPHDLILEGLRPVLKRARGVERTPTPLRLFCQPFQDLLSSLPRKQKQLGRIALSSIHPVWNWVARTLLPGETAAYCEGIKGDVLTVSTMHNCAHRNSGPSLRARFFPL
jgi:hypothetical protein